MRRVKRGRMPQVGLRVPPEYLERADALIEHLRPIALVAELSRSDVLRIALERGLTELEAQAGHKPKAPRKRRQG